MLSIVLPLLFEQALTDLQKVVLEAPAEEMARSRDGIEVIRLVIAPDGSLAGCYPQIVGRGPIEDRRSCRKLSKLTFAPSPDQAAHKVYGETFAIVTWQAILRGQASPRVYPKLGPELYLPLARLPDGLANPAVRLGLLVEADGKVEHCEVKKSSGSASLDKAACGAVIQDGVEPLKIASGETVRGVRIVDVGFKVLSNQDKAAEGPENAASQKH
ncbi:energy transducer TonB [Sphingomonas sp. IC081]|uniref:energy transducer TonB n=2 Tax=Sphingomonadaceae TaxID=41297 RepID=UPI00163C33F1|nr:energy transducer TonB [Sphingomonas sp. IC081]